MAKFAAIANHVTKPNATDARYVLRRVTKMGPPNTWFNGAPRPDLRRVEIHALRIEHGREGKRDRDDEYLSPLRPYVEAQDITELQVAAHEIQLNAPLVLFQTRVTVIAQKFMARSGIATNPKPTELPTAGGEAALPGQDGGDVTIRCRDFAGTLNVRSVGSPGQMLARKRTSLDPAWSPDYVPPVACSLNDPDQRKAIAALNSFGWAEIASLGGCMRPSMADWQHHLSWPKFQSGRSFDEMASWAGRITYVRAEPSPQLLARYQGWPENRCWEAGTLRGPWDDDGNCYGTPAPGGNGGSLRSNSKELLAAAVLTANAGVSSYAQPETEQQPNPAVHLYLRLEDATYRPMPGAEAGVRVEYKRKAPPEAPRCATEGNEGKKELLPDDTPTTTPEVLDLALLYAKDLYLAGYADEAGDMLRSLDFSRMQDVRSRSLAIEAGVLLQRLEQGLDFYGNPRDWVPLLSVDTNLGVFQAEIERSLELLYLAHIIEAHWNTLEEQGRIVEESQKQARALAEEAQRKLQATRQKIGFLEGEISEIETLSKDFKARLDRLQEELRKKAGDTVRNKLAQEDIASILKVLTAVGSLVVPVAGPYTAVATKTLDMVSDLSATIPDDSVKWSDNLVSAFQKTHEVAKAGLADPEVMAMLRDHQQAPGKEVEEARRSVAEIDVKLAKLAAADRTEKQRLERERAEFQATVDAMEGRLTDATAKFNAQCEKIGTALGTVNTAIKKLVVSGSDVDKRVVAELEKLKAADVPFQALKKSLDELTAKRARVATTMLDLEVQTGRLAASLVAGAINLDTLFRERGRTFELLDPRIRQLANRLRQQATEGLNKYQYFLKKSYEYNFLEPAEYDYGVAALQRQVAAYLSKGDATRTLTREQFAQLGALYQGMLGKLGARLIESLQGSYGRYQSEVVISLKGEDLTALSRDKQFTLDLGAHLPDKSEDIRIRDVVVESISLRPLGRPDNLQVRLWHSGVSTVRRDGRDYRFVSTSPRMWGADLDSRSGTIARMTPADKVDAELVRRLFDSAASPKETVETLGRYNPAFSGPLLIELIAGEVPLEGVLTALSLRFKLELRPIP